MNLGVEMILRPESRPYSRPESDTGLDLMILLVGSDDVKMMKGFQEVVAV